MLQGKRAEARGAYKTALERADEKDPNFKERVQRKLDGLGAA